MLALVLGRIRLGGLGVRDFLRHSSLFLHVGMGLHLLAGLFVGGWSLDCCRTGCTWQVVGVLRLGTQLLLCWIEVHLALSLNIVVDQILSSLLQLVPFQFELLNQLRSEFLLHLRNARRVDVL